MAQAAPSAAPTPPPPQQQQQQQAGSLHGAAQTQAAGGPRTCAVLLCTRSAFGATPDELDTWAFHASTAATPAGVETYCLRAVDGDNGNRDWSDFCALPGIPEWSSVLRQHNRSMVAQEDEWRKWEDPERRRRRRLENVHGHSAAATHAGGGVAPVPPHFQHTFTGAQWEKLQAHLELLLNEPTVEQQELQEEPTVDCSDPTSSVEPKPPLDPPDLQSQPPQPPRMLARLPPAEDAKPIFDSQKAVAKGLFERIAARMDHLKSPLSGFSEIDFRILTAGFNTLKEQTVRRLEGLLEADQFDMPNNAPAKNLVMIYGSGSDQRESFEALRRSARSCPQRLHVIIADEAHWGTTYGGWNSYYVNDAAGATQEHRGLKAKDGGEGALLECKNVIVLLVTATPYNLLSRHSRVPQADHTVHGNDFHIVCWDEQVLAAPSPTVSAVGPNAPSASERGTSSPSGDATPVLVCHLITYYQNGSEGSAQATEFLTVRDAGASAVLGTSANPANVGIFSTGRSSLQHHVAFRSANQWRWLTETLRLSENRSDAAMFTVHQEHGYSVVALELVGGNAAPSGRYITVASDNVALLPKDDTRRLEWQFFLQPVLDGPGKVYKSLNYYFNTMRLSDYDRRLIRTDPFLEEIVPKLTHRELAADYVYSILHFRVFFGTDCLRDDKNIAPKSAMLLTKDRAWFQERFAELKRCTDEFQRRFGDLLDRKDDSKQRVSREARLQLDQQFLQPYRALVRAGLDDVLTGKVSPGSEEGQLSLWSALKHDPALADDEHRFVQVCSYLFDYWEASALLAEQMFAYSRSETEYLIEDLIVNNTAEVQGGGRAMSGKMKIVRIFQENLATHFYFAVLLASDIAKFRNTFCILRDYSKFDISKSFQSPAVFAPAAASGTVRSSSDVAAEDSAEYAYWTAKLTRPRNAPDTWTPDQYEHLDNLPCILVLVQKGRMGDTFPNSFNCMDIRLSYADRRNRVELSTLVQELGRLCRYAPANAEEQSLPYAIVSGTLHKRLTSALTNSLSLASEFVRQPDTYLKKAPGTLVGTMGLPRRWLHMEPTDKHYDHVGSGLPQRVHKPHDRRFVLVAEPQIGKTGTYLALLKLLSAAINAQPWYVFETKCFVNPRLLPESSPEVWRYPHWRLMEQFFPTMADQEISKGKYDDLNPVRPGKPWHYGFQLPPGRLKELGNAVLPTEEGDGGDMNEDGLDGSLAQAVASDPVPAVLARSKVYNASDYPNEAHTFQHTCVACEAATPDGGAVKPPREMYLDLARIAKATGCSFRGQARTSVWVPASANLAELVVEPGEALATGWFEPKPSLSTHSIRFWILTPSGRPTTARLNLHHALGDGHRAEQIVFCRKAHASEFKKCWGHRKVIIVLPDWIDSGTDSASAEAGVGFSRLFMQLFAETFGMPFVFMIDDNIFHMAQLVMPLTLRNADSPTARVYESETCALGTVLAHLQAPAVAATTGNVPQLAYTYPKGEAGAQTTPGIIDLAKVPDPAPPELTGPGLGEYMGSIDKYALLGTFRCDVLTTAAAPFKRGHVYSLVLLNVTVTKNRGVRFRPWPFWEDLNFNEQCDRNGLYVCKFNRFIQLKRWRPLPGARPAPRTSEPPSSPPPPATPGQQPNGALYEWPHELIASWPSAGDSSSDESHVSALESVLQQIVVGLNQDRSLDGARVCLCLDSCYHELHDAMETGRLKFGNSIHIFPKIGPASTAQAPTVPGQADLATVVLVAIASPPRNGNLSLLEWSTVKFFGSVVLELVQRGSGSAVDIILVVRAEVPANAPSASPMIYEWSELRGTVSHALRTCQNKSAATAPLVGLVPDSFKVLTVKAPEDLTSPTMLVLRLKLEVMPVDVLDANVADAASATADTSARVMSPPAVSSPTKIRRVEDFSSPMSAGPSTHGVANGGGSSSSSQQGKRPRSPPAAGDDVLASPAPKKATTGTSGIAIVGSDEQTLVIGGKETTLQTILDAIKHAVSRRGHAQVYTRPSTDASNGEVIANGFAFSADTVTSIVSAFRLYRREQARRARALKAAGSSSGVAPANVDDSDD